MVKARTTQPTGQLSDFLIGLLVGLATGTLLSVLLAPQSGSQTRQQAKALPTQLRNDWRNPYGRTRTLVGRGQAKLEGQWDAAQGRMRARRLAKAKQKESSLQEEVDSGFLG